MSSAVKHQPATPLHYADVQSAYASARASHPEEQPGRIEGADAMEQELDRRSDAYPRLVEALRNAIQDADDWHDDNRGGNSPCLDAERALLRELGEAE